MRIAQIVLPNASHYERKCQRADHAVLAERHEVAVIAVEDAATSGAEVAHVYATHHLPSAAFVGFPLPYVASADVRRSRWPFRRPVEPDYVVSPLVEKVEQSRFQPLPEAVEEVYFERAQGAGRRAQENGARVIGSFARASVRPLVEQTLLRIHRFREDVTWNLYGHVPTPEDLARVDVWVDPAADDSDLDGFVAEALVVGLPVVATRTAINVIRLERGRTGMLVPPGDPNELTHAILALLFKSEVAQNKTEAARQTASKFRARQRLRVLAHMYDTLIS
jgi:hypothetical protein